MKLIINKDRSVIPVGTWGTVNENNYEILEFEFPDELKHFNKRIVYYLGDERVWDAIVGNKAYITNAITKKGDVKAYVWCTKENTEREADTDFRTMLFEMHFYENENADGIVPTEEQVDGFNTMLTAMNRKIDEVNALETTIEQEEADRQENENARISNEQTRQSNESTRESNEQTRQLQETDRERRTSEAIADIQDKTAEYNANAEAKTNEFNQNATQKTNEFNSNYTQKVNEFNSNATTQTSEFNSNASSKTSVFNSNAETKTNAFNTNATNKTNDFNSNATEKTTTFDNNASTKTSEFNTNAESKTSEFNSNAESKTTAFNENATSKTNDFNDNATEKTTAYNTNAQNKIDEYDEHIVEYQAQIDELQEEVEELSENMPWNETEQATEINITDAAKYSRNKLELFGNTSQDSTTGKNLLEGIELGEINSNTGATSSSSNSWRSINFIAYDTSETYYFSINSELSRKTFNLRFYNKDYEYIGYSSASTGSVHNTSINKTTSVEDDTPKYFKFRTSLSGLNEGDKAMISTSSDTTFEPYTGGQPSPNPDYPQDIHVVTGNNTIVVGDTNYPVNLGNIELCKIRDYQDYLYKENGNWYKYGAIDKYVYNDDLTYNATSENYISVLTPVLNIGILSQSQLRYISYCNMFTTYSINNTGFNGTTNSHKIRINISFSYATTLAEVKALCEEKSLSIYYGAETPTSTQITDETLIAQLDEIYEHLKLVKGTNNITVTASDLKPLMKLSYMQDLQSKLDKLDSRLALLE